MTHLAMWFGLIGSTTRWSLSPAMHEAGLAAWGKPGRYGAFDVAPGNLATALEGLRSLGFAGINVTMPHKEAVLAHVQPDDLAMAIGAANALRFGPDGIITATNTDAEGFHLACRMQGLDWARIQRAVVLGAGGAARAVWYALRKQGISAHLLARCKKNIQIDSSWVEADCISAETLRRVLPGCDLLVDCTPCGWFVPERDMPPVEALRQIHPALDLMSLPAHATVMDVAARPQTVLTRAAADRGLHAFAGLGMLLYQGVCSLEYWLQEPVPAHAIGAMQQALENPRR